MKEIVLDTETTGLLVKDGHRIVEIGCIELDNLIPTKNIFHCYLNPERKVSEKAFEVHGYSDEFLSSKQKFSDIADIFLEFIKDKKMSGVFNITEINSNPKHLTTEISGILNQRVGLRALKDEKVTYRIQYRYNLGRLSISRFTRVEGDNNE